jgi:hypothetical protein
MFDSPFMSLPGISPQEYSYLQSATTGFSEQQLRGFLMIYSSKRRNPDDMVLYCILGWDGNLIFSDHWTVFYWNYNRPGQS